MRIEIISYPEYYPNLHEPVYAPHWYLKGHFDEYSNKIVSSKRNDESNFFLPYLKNLLQELKNLNYIGKINLVTIVPNSHLSYSPTLENIGLLIASYLNAKYEKLIIRTREGRRNQRGNFISDRFIDTSNSMQVIRHIQDEENSILLIDGTKTSGITNLECIKILKDNGARSIVCICLGINHNPEFFGEEE